MQGIDTAINAAMQGGAPAPKQTGSDAQNAAILASIAAPQTATPAQNSAAVSAVNARLASADRPVPGAFAQQQQAAAQAPYDLASKIAGNEHAAAGNYTGALSSGADHYLSQLAAATPLVNALASAQIAAANNQYAQQQGQNAYQHDYLDYQNRSLDAQNRQLALSQSNPGLYGTAAQQTAAKNAVVQGVNSDAGLDSDEKKYVNQILGQAYDYPSALALLSGTTYDSGSNKGKPLAHTPQAQKWIAAYYGAGTAPQATLPDLTAPGTTAAAPAPAAKKKAGPSTWDAIGDGFSSLGRFF